MVMLEMESDHSHLQGRFEGANGLPITPTESTFVSTLQSSRNGTRGRVLR